MLWEMDESRTPVDPKERATGWQALLGLTRQDLETGTAKDWGALVGEHKGFVIHEGTEVEVAVTLQKFVPFARFRVYALASLDQVMQVTEALLK